ncbi:hypothetical protein ASC89_07770 [Devosia sp. Root413D1]|nr:hypothetical protein ASC89_07770 [Devosia sp. Root413D1]
MSFTVGLSPATLPNSGHEKTRRCGGFALLVDAQRLAASKRRRRLGSLECRFLHRGSDQAFTNGGLASGLAAPTYCLGGFTNPLFRRLLVIAAEFHLPEDTLTLQALLEYLESLIDVIVANENLQTLS